MRQILIGLLWVGLSAGSLSACTHFDGSADKGAQDWDPLDFDLSGTEKVEVPLERSTASGRYLAARFAWSERNVDAASDFFSGALVDDPGNTEILQRAFLVAAGAGHMDRAIDLAGQLAQDGQSDALANFVLAVQAMKKEDWQKAEKLFTAREQSGLLRYVSVVGEAWTLVEEGRVNDAIDLLANFDTRASFDLFRNFHSALILDITGDRERADKAYNLAMSDSNGTSLRVVEAYISFLSRTGRSDVALDLLNRFQEAGTENPALAADAAILEKGETLPPMVSTPSQGVAEALYSLARALAQQGGQEIADLYLQFALYLRPDFDLVRLLLADDYDVEGRYREAVDVFQSIPASSPYYLEARRHAAAALDEMGETDAAIALLERIIEADPGAPESWHILGDVYRKSENFEAAEKAYSSAIDLLNGSAPQDWVLYYARGICRERLGQWADAESDLTTAMDLSDSNPLVLNYLGYSYIEQGQHLDRSLAMIKQAVAAEPEDGYIVDSLGWAYYRLGDYEQAVEHLQRAVELVPFDPIVNDHLGDAYWKAGRKLEARFQWSHALDLDPEKDLIADLETKLVFGLDEVSSAPRNTVASPGPESSAGQHPQSPYSKP